jgi:hypothetical protein
MLTFLKRLASSVPTPASGKITLFGDSTTGQPYYKKDDGTTASLVGATGATGAAGANGQGVPTGGTAGQVLAKIDGTDYNTHWIAASSGTTLPTTYFQHQAALLEPAALEVLQYNTFSYAVTTSPKYCIASWQTRLSSSGRMEVRNPFKPFRLRNQTMAGSASGSAAMFLDPAAATYADPVTTYYNRLGDLQSLDQKYLPITAASQTVPLLPGPYGSFITHYTCFNFPWLVLRWSGDTIGINLGNEVSDATTQRIGNDLLMPISKKTVSEIQSSSTSSSTGGAASGAICVVDVPSTWAAITEPLTASYGSPTFRDDFMTGSALDTSVWTRTQSTAGNVEYHGSRPWLKFTGSGTWGQNGLYKTTGQARSNGRKLIVDLYTGRGTITLGLGMVGWSDGLGQSYTNFAHAINFAGGGGAGTINVYENGTLRGTVGSGWTEGTIYRLYIEQTTTGAIYKIQGGTQYPALDSGSWTTITPGTTSSATATLTPGATCFQGTGYLSDFRVFG